MKFEHFFIIDAILSSAFLTLEIGDAPCSACAIIALQFSVTLAAICLARQISPQKKFFYYIVAAAMATRCALDLLEFVSLGTFLPKVNAPDLYAAFAIPMLLLCGSLFYYFTETMHRYEPKQMLLDSYKVAAVIITTVGATTINAYDKSSTLVWELSPYCISFVIHTLISCAIIILSLIIVLSRRGGKLHFSVVGLILFYLLMASRHILLTWYLEHIVVFNPRIIEYILVIACVILSATIQCHYKIHKARSAHVFSPEVEQPENIGKTRTGLFLVAISAIIWFIGLLPTPVFLLLMFILYILQRMDALVQRTYDINAQLIQELTIDALTGLHNRSYFAEELNSYAEKQKTFTLFFVNLIRFKIINNIHGAEAGDDVLREVANRLSRLQKKRKDISLFRCNGDEFAILLEDDTPEQINALAQLLIATVESPLKIEQLDLSMNVGVGAARYPADTQDTQELLKYADNAMRKAKQQEEIRFIKHSPAFAAELEKKHQLERKLQQPGFTRELSLFYQPKIKIADKKLYEMEALTRWFDRDGKPVFSPAEFIPMAEEMGKIDEISEWVFDTAFRQIKAWNETYHTNHIVNINVSPITIHNKMFVKNLCSQIEETGVKPEWIGIEITEYSAMTAPKYIGKVLTSISDLGIKISIDDFGTGYSSLSYLKLFDIDELKIAKELIDHIDKGHNDYQIVNAIIKMAQGLSLTTVAEGVEMEEQLTILEELGCDTIQGYFFEKPLPGKELEERYLANPKGH